MSSCPQVCNNITTIATDSTTKDILMKGVGPDYSADLEVKEEKYCMPIYWNQMSHNIQWME